MISMLHECAVPDFTLLREMSTWTVDPFAPLLLMNVFFEWIIWSYVEGSDLQLLHEAKTLFNYLAKADAENHLHLQSLMLSTRGYVSYPEKLCSIAKPLALLGQASLEDKMIGAIAVLIVEIYGRGLMDGERQLDGMFEARAGVTEHSDDFHLNLLLTAAERKLDRMYESRAHTGTALCGSTDEQLTILMKFLLTSTRELRVGIRFSTFTSLTSTSTNIPPGYWFSASITQRKQWAEHTHENSPHRLKVQQSEVVKYQRRIESINYAEAASLFLQKYCLLTEPLKIALQKLLRVFQSTATSTVITKVLAILRLPLQWHDHSLEDKANLKRGVMLGIKYVGVN